MKIKHLKTENLKFSDFETKENKKGEKFYIMKVYTENSSGRDMPVILDKETTTLGLRRVLRDDGKISHLYFPITFTYIDDDAEWIEKFNKICDFIREHVNKQKISKQFDEVSFDKFNPLKEGEFGEDSIMFLRVGYNNGMVFSNFYERGRKRLDIKFMIDQPLDVDVKIKIDSVFINSKNAYLQVSLKEAIVDPISRCKRISEEDGEILYSEGE